MWVLGLAIIGLIAFILSNGASEAGSFDRDQQPSLGKASAPVEIVEFGDYNCSSCKKFNDNLFLQMQEELIATGKVKFYYVHHPVIQEDSKRAARFAEAVYQVLGNDVFWQFHHVVFDNLQDKGEEQRYTDAYLKQTLNGLVSEEKTEEVMKAYNDGTGSNAIDDDISYAKEMNVSDTPVLYVDGKRFEGESLAELKKMVEQATH